MREACICGLRPPATHSVLFITLSPLSCLLLHISPPLCFVSPFSPFHAEMQYSADPELILASVPCPALFGCLNGPSYTILTTMISFIPSELSPILHLHPPYSPASSRVPLLLISQLLHYVLRFKDRTHPLPPPLVAWSGQFNVKIIWIWEHKQNS